MKRVRAGEQQRTCARRVPLVRDGCKKKQPANRPQKGNGRESEIAIQQQFCLLAARNFVR